MRIFLTGGAGFIGSALAEQLVAKGQEVTVFDNLSTGRRENIAALEGRLLRLVRGDVCAPEDVRNAAAGHDVVYHLAALATVRGSFDDRQKDFLVNTGGTRSVLEAAAAGGAKRFVFMSSNAVYGDGPFPVSESFGPLLPTSPYGASKAAGEAMVAAYANGFGFTAHIFRSGRVVGDRARRGVVYDFVRKLKTNPKRLEILGDGQQKASYLHVDDAARALLLGLEHPGAGVTVTNMAGHGLVTVDDIALEAIVACGLSPCVVETAYTGGKYGWKGDMPLVSVRTDRARAYGWQPSLSSMEAVAMTAKELAAAKQD